MLLDRGANPNARAEVANTTPLHHAAEEGHIEVVRLLLDRGAAPNAREDIGDMTPLHHAAQLGYLEAVRLLLDRGGDPNARDEDGETPLDLADDDEVIALLRERSG